MKGGKLPPKNLPAAPPQKPEIKQRDLLLFLSKPITQYIIIAALALLFYFDSVPGEYVLDDGLVLFRNEYVKKGISGIPDILTHDSFYGSIGNSANLTGGRYRPLSEVTFAIETSLYGLTPHFSRFINVLLYALTGIVLLVFFRRFIFPSNPIASFIAVLLFIIHPIHTEVVANIKSRDEILSLLLLTGTLYYLLRVVKENASPWYLLISVAHFALALLAKENGLMFIFIIPLTIYIFSKKNPIGIFNYSLPYLAVVILYVAVRINLVGLANSEVKELLDNPYMQANMEEKLATITLVFLYYLKLLFFPHPLTYDYTYNQIPYTHFSDWRVILSIIINGALLIYAFRQLKNRSIYSWGILFHFASLFIVSNLIINIGAPMGERFLYQPSVAFVIIIVQLCIDLYKRYKVNVSRQTIISTAIIIPLVVLCFLKTYSRNKIWLVGEVMGTTDVKVSSNSARANAYAGVNYINMAYNEKDSLKKRELNLKAIPYLKKAIDIYSSYGMAYQNLGLAYYQLDSIERAGEMWLKASQMNVGVSNLLPQFMKEIARHYYEKGMKEGAVKNFNAAVSDLREALKYDANNPEAWYNLGGAYFSVNQRDSARGCWENALRLKPDYKEAVNGLKAVGE